MKFFHYTFFIVGISYLTACEKTITKDECTPQKWFYNTMWNISSYTLDGIESIDTIDLYYPEYFLQIENYDERDPYSGEMVSGFLKVFYMGKDNIIYNELILTECFHLYKDAKVNSTDYFYSDEYGYSNPFEGASKFEVIQANNKNIILKALNTTQEHIITFNPN